MEKNMNKRSSNYSETEVECLISLVEKFKDILENKETDMVTWKTKEKAWVSLAEHFNSMGFPTRAPRQLREKWSNLKKETKKKYSFEKNEFYKTGGGNPQVCTITKKDERVKELIGVAVTGLQNDFDDDSQVHNLGQLTSDATNSTDGTWATWNPQSLRKPVSEQLSVEAVPQSSKKSGPTWSAMKITPEQIGNLMAQQKSEAGKKFLKVTTNQLGIPSTSGLLKTQMLRLVPKAAKIQIEETDNDTNMEALPDTLKRAHQECIISEDNTPDTPRKQPLKQMVTPAKKPMKKTQLTMDCRVKINSLSEAKMELVKIQQKCLLSEDRRKEEEHALQTTQMKAEHEVRMKKLNLEVEILQRNLK